MSILNLTDSLENHGPLVLPEIGKVRLAEATDAPFIFKLVNEPMAKTFRILAPDEIVYLMWVTNQWLEFFVSFSVENNNNAYT